MKPGGHGQKMGFADGEVVAHRSRVWRLGMDLCVSSSWLCYGHSNARAGGDGLSQHINLETVVRRFAFISLYPHVGLVLRSTADNTDGRMHLSFIGECLLRVQAARTTRYLVMAICVRYMLQRIDRRKCRRQEQPRRVDTRAGARTQGAAETRGQSEES